MLDGSVREKQLLNLAENPNEFLAEHQAEAVRKLTRAAPQPHQTNLAKDPQYAEKLAEMEQLLLAEMRRLNDPWRMWDQPDDGLGNLNATWGLSTEGNRSGAAPKKALYPKNHAKLGHGATIVIELCTLRVVQRGDSPLAIGLRDRPQYAQTFGLPANAPSLKSYLSIRCSHADHPRQAGRFCDGVSRRSFLTIAD